MDPELMRVLVPLGLFAFWALTKLSERNVKPLEIKSARPPAVNDPFRTTSAQPPPPRTQPSLRWSNQVSGSSSPGGADDIIILGSETRPIRQPQRRAQPRRQNQQQPKPQTPKQPKKPKLGDLSSDVARSLKDSMPIQPLSSISTGTLLTGAAGKEASATPSRPAPLPLLAVEDLRASLRDPQKVREALIMSEILGPPVALRHRRRGL